MGKAATTMRSAGRAMGQAGDVGRAQETVEAVQQQLQDLEAQFEAEVRRGDERRPTPPSRRLETWNCARPATNINVRLVALVWLPFSRTAAGGTHPAY